MADPSYIRELWVVNNRADRDFRIDLTPTPGRDFMHLILTGKNGSGKTSTLRLLWDATKDRISSSSLKSALIRRSVENHPPCVVPTWSAREEPSVEWVINLPARRRFMFLEVKGPTKNLAFNNADDLEQVLVNLRTQVAHAKEAGDEQAAEGFERRLATYEDTFRKLLAEPDLRLVFDRPGIRYRLSMNGREMELNQLPDGYQNAIHAWAEIHSTIQRHGGEDWGVVLIDEVEPHLHLELQERFLPFLASLFPRMQFIAATHSPAVVSSIDGAVVYDLSTHSREISDDLRGLRYGTLVTSHFGLESDFDAASTEELRELSALHRKSPRTPEEEARLRELAARLSARSHPLVMKVWNELECGDR